MRHYRNWEIADIGVLVFAKNGNTIDEDFHDLIAERYERKSTVITSNLDFTEWGDVFPNKLLGAATLDRLKHGAYRLILDGKSYRKPRPMQDQLEKGKG